MRSTPLARFGIALVLALAAWLWSWWPLLAGLLWGFALKCDDACGGDGWRESADAWQWQAIAALGAAAFLTATALVLLVVLRRRRAALGALVAEILVTQTLMTLLAPDWWRHVDRNALAILATLAAAAAGVGAVALTPPRRVAS
jgi:hypothetical protein